ncbi:hypothetical protein C8F04DRAFT_1183989 [Mycena alexandri]|uniref:Uncharacterized protein n=1 Tax=Mycena alexandri TaxID=1745969 RepID=A0AAD6ST27_9AGAR|nr:hypothetical protein C8F04DRAFT_1183989 [Mycena alexandri]
MVQLSATFVTLCAAACALGSAMPVKRQTTIPQCAVDTVQYLFWVNTIDGAVQSSSDTITGAEAVALPRRCRREWQLRRPDGFSTNIVPVFDELSKLLTELDSESALTALANAQEFRREIAANFPPGHCDAEHRQAPVIGGDPVATGMEVEFEAIERRRCIWRLATDFQEDGSAR